MFRVPREFKQISTTLVRKKNGSLYNTAILIAVTFCVETLLKQIVENVLPGLKLSKQSRKKTPNSLTYNFVFINTFQLLDPTFISLSPLPVQVFVSRSIPPPIRPPRYVFPTGGNGNKSLFAVVVTYGRA